MVERCFKERGWREWDEDRDPPAAWSVWWKSGRFKAGAGAARVPILTDKVPPQCIPTSRRVELSHRSR